VGEDAVSSRIAGRDLDFIRELRSKTYTGRGFIGARQVPSHASYRRRAM
jgi:hypothetical protein